MTVRDLKKFFSSLMIIQNIYEIFHGKTIGIDISCLIHFCAYFEENILPSVEYENYSFLVNSVISIVCQLRMKGLIPICVFDGKGLPQKEPTRQLRLAKYENATAEYKGLLARGGTPAEELSAARKCFKRTHELEDSLIYGLHQKNIDLIIAPFEADAQLAYLNRIGLLNAVLTVDADLIAFGASIIIFPVERQHDWQGGNCLIYRNSCLLPNFLVPNCSDLERLIKVQTISQKLGIPGLALLCCIAGCDYFPKGVDGVGLRKAIDVVESFAKMKPTLPSLLPTPEIDSSNLQQLFDLTFTSTKLQTNFSNVKLHLIDAIQGFLCQPVFNILSNRLEYIFPNTSNPLQTLQSDIEFCRGSILSVNSINSPTTSDHLQYGARFLTNCTDPLPTYLLPSMVIGATSPDFSKPLSRDSMVRFLQTRGFTKSGRGGYPSTDYSTFSDEYLLSSVKSQVENERDKLIYIHSPERLSLRAFYEAAHIPFSGIGKMMKDIPLSEFRSINRHFSLNPESIKTLNLSWTTAPNLLIGMIPYFENNHISDYLRVDGKPNNLIEAKGWKMIKDYSSIYKKLKGACLSPQRYIFTSEVPATMKQVCYTTSVLLKSNVPEALDTHWTLKLILNAACTCKAGESRKCTHVAAVLYTLEQYHHLTTPSTSQPRNLTFWKPLHKDSYDPTMHLHEVPFEMPNRKRDLRKRNEDLRPAEKRKFRVQTNQARWDKREYQERFAAHYDFNSESHRIKLDRFWIAMRRKSIPQSTQISEME